MGAPVLMARIRCVTIAICAYLLGSIQPCWRTDLLAPCRAGAIFSRSVSDLGAVCGLWPAGGWLGLAATYARRLVGANASRLADVISIFRDVAGGDLGCARTVENGIFNLRRMDPCVEFCAVLGGGSARLRALCVAGFVGVGVLIAVAALFGTQWMDKFPGLTPILRRLPHFLVGRFAGAEEGFSPIN